MNFTAISTALQNSSRSCPAFCEFTKDWWSNAIANPDARSKLMSMALFKMIGQLDMGAIVDAPSHPQTNSFMI